MRTILFLCCLCLFANRGAAATADIQISSDHTPETTSQTVGSAAVVGIVSTLNFPGSAIVNYSVQETSIWSISPTTGILSRKAGFSINFEAPPANLQATVTASDSRGPTTVTKVFTITIDDVNERPTAVSFLTGGSVAENAAATVGTLTANDPENGTLTFATTDPRFTITGNTLSALANQLNFETNPTTNVNIQVTDSGADNGTVTLTLTVNITDVNERPTAVSFLAGGSVAENAAATVGTLTANDPENGTLTFATTDTRFTITGNTLSALANQLDFETNPTTNVNIQVTDSGVGSGTVTLTLSVNITNVNERPTAVSFLTGGSVAENAAATVGTLTANDPENGSLTFTTTDTRFTITGNTLSALANKLDFETETTTTVSIQVTDSGTGSGTVTLTLTVNITNVNERPTTVSFLTGGSVAENVAATVGTLTANDPEHGTLTFATTDPRFTITGNTLSTLANQLDFETTPITNVSIQVTDSGPGSGAVTLTLSVNITDVNERPTAVSFLTGGSVAENAAATVGTLTANDPENGTLTFATMDPRFTITGNTLSVLANQLDFETTPTTNVDIQVTDSGAGSGTVTLTLPVTVINVNEPPTTVSFSNGGSIDENTVGDVGTLTANDPEKGQLTFATSDPRFSILGTTLSMKPGQTLDFEATATATTNLSIQVTDSGAGSTTTTLTCVVTVINKNDPIALSTWTSPISVGNASKPLPILTSNDHFTDEDTVPKFRDYHGMSLEISFPVDANSANDDLGILLDNPTTVNANFTLENRQKKPTDGSRISVKRNGSVIATCYGISENNFYKFRIELTNDAKIPLLIDYLTDLVRLVSYLPDANSLSTSRKALTLSLKFNDDTAGDRIINLDTANLPPSISPEEISVTRLSQVAITPQNLRIVDTHPDLGFTITIDSPTFYGDLKKNNGTVILGPNDTVDVLYVRPVAPQTVGTYVLDLIYIPRSNNSSATDTCFISVSDHGVVSGADASTFLATAPTKLTFSIKPTSTPVITNFIPIQSFTEGSAGTLLITSGNGTTAPAIEISGATALPDLSLGNWNLYATYSSNDPNQGPLTASENLIISPTTEITLGADGRSVIYQPQGLSAVTIAQIDSTQNGQGKSLICNLTTAATARAVTALIATLTYQDASQRINVGTNENRSLFVGFSAKSTGQFGIDYIRISITRIGVDNLPIWSDGAEKKIITVSDQPITGSSSLEDVDTPINQTTQIVVTSSTVGATGNALIRDLPFDTSGAFRANVTWQLTRNTAVPGPQQFFLTTIIGGKQISQTLTLSPRSGSDLGLAIASDAPLAFSKPIGAAVPLKRALRVRRGSEAVDDVAFFLLGNDIPLWITIDSTAGTVSYDLANPLAVAGVTYRFSVLATIAATASSNASAAEQPVVLRVVAQPVQSGTN